MAKKVKKSKQKYWYKLISGVYINDGKYRPYYHRCSVLYEVGKETWAPEGGDLFIFKTLKDLNATDNEYSYLRVIPLSRPLKPGSKSANDPCPGSSWPNGTYFTKGVKVVALVKREDY